MHALILAAGRGERMRPLTDDLPKPLLYAGGLRLIEHHLLALAEAGFDDVVVNHAHLGAKIIATLGDGSRYGVRIAYSAEPAGALETGGGIVHALQLLQSDPFIVINGDIWADYPLAMLRREPEGSAHLILVNNPPHNPQGDFLLSGDCVSIPDSRVRGDAGGRALTFSGIGVYRRALFQNPPAGRFALGPLLKEAAANHEVTGEHHRGGWIDVGTPERLAELHALLSDRQRTR